MPASTWAWAGIADNYLPHPHLCSSQAFLLPGQEVRITLVYWHVPLPATMPPPTQITCSSGFPPPTTRSHPSGQVFKHFIFGSGLFFQTDRQFVTIFKKPGQWMGGGWYSKAVSTTNSLPHYAVFSQWWWAFSHFVVTFDRHFVVRSTSFCE